jgi:hypothetical protein
MTKPRTGSSHRPAGPRRWSAAAAALPAAAALATGLLTLSSALPASASTATARAVTPASTYTLKCRTNADAAWVHLWFKGGSPEVPGCIHGTGHAATPVDLQVFCAGNNTGYFLEPNGKTKIAFKPGEKKRLASVTRISYTYITKSGGAGSCPINEP